MGNCCRRAKPPKIEPVPVHLPHFIQWSGGFLNGQMHGFGTETNTKTNLTGTGQYCNGYRVGVWEFWDGTEKDSVREYDRKTGALLNLINYHNGVANTIYPPQERAKATVDPEKTIPKPVETKNEEPSLKAGLQDFGF